MSQLPKYKQIDVILVVETATKAASAILEVYKSSFDIILKEDKSPLTEADKKSNKIIEDSLKKHFPEIPILSEESKQIPYSERKNWKQFWLVDPLDGTKEFINRNGDFTVNIALIEGNKPVLGVVYVPVLNLCYVGISDKGAFKIEQGKAPLRIDNKTATPLKSLKLIRVVGSRSHLSAETIDFVNELKEEGKDVVFVSRGSSLKLCLVAEGEADIYPRFGPTMEWDTAAAQAVVEAAGKNVIDFTTNKPLCYNKENLLNNWFLVQ